MNVQPSNVAARGGGPSGVDRTVVTLGLTTQAGPRYSRFFPNQRTFALDFEPFPVVCVTCGCRLRVARRELVDTIVKCPKCQSLVQLTRDTDPSAAGKPVAVGDGSVDTEAVTQDSIAPPPPGETGAGERSSSAPPPVFDSAPEAFGQMASGESEAADTSEIGQPLTDWQASRTAKTRQIAAIVAASVIALTIVIVLAVVLLRGGGAETQTAANVPDEVAEPDPADDSAADPAELDATTDPTGIDDENSANQVDETAEVETQDSATEATDNPAQDAMPNGNDLAEMPDDLLPQNPLLDGNPLLPDNPLGGNPLGGGSIKESETPEDAEGTFTELPPELRGLFNELGGMDRPQFSNTAPPPPTIDEFQVDQAAGMDVDGELMIEAQQPINMREALGIKVAFQAGHPDGYPLNDLLLRLSQLSGVPIDVHWVSFDLMGTPINQRIALPNGWNSLEEILEFVGESTGSVHEPNPRSITFRPSDDLFAARIAECVDLTDLDASAVAAARELLRQTGPGTEVEVPSNSGQQQMAALVCDAIRRVRGQTGKMNEEAFQRWGGPVSTQVNGWPLIKDSSIADGSSGPVAFQASTVVGMLIKLSKQNGATCFVNWIDGAAKGVAPTDRRMPRTGPNVSLTKSLDHLLVDTALQVRLVDSQHWWVGSQASFDRFPAVVWFDDASRDAEQTRAMVQTLLDGTPADARGFGQVTVDAGSNRCVAILPRFLLRQLPRLLSGDEG
ncbi:MAG: hypothetical protein AAFV88_06190 [Planctomycetota bacterium]